MKFKLEIDLTTPEMADHHDVAAALKDVGKRLDRYVSSGWSPYAQSGKIYDRSKNEVGRWEIEADPEVQKLVDGIKVFQKEQA